MPHECFPPDTPSRAICYGCTLLQNGGRNKQLSGKITRLHVVDSAADFILHSPASSFPHPLPITCLIPGICSIQLLLTSGALFPYYYNAHPCVCTAVLTAVYRSWHVANTRKHVLTSTKRMPTTTADEGAVDSISIHLSPFSYRRLTQPQNKHAKLIQTRPARDVGRRERLTCLNASPTPAAPRCSTPRVARQPLSPRPARRSMRYPANSLASSL